jgi:hypothetical protein
VWVLMCEAIEQRRAEGHTRWIARAALFAIR